MEALTLTSVLGDELGEMEVLGAHVLQVVLLQGPLDHLGRLVLAGQLWITKQVNACTTHTSRSHTCTTHTSRSTHVQHTTRKPRTETLVIQAEPERITQ